MTWKNYFAILSLIVFPSCKGVPPAWFVDLYQGDSTRGGIVRCTSPKSVKPCQKWDVIMHNDPKLDEFTCMKTVKIVERQKQIEAACEKWK